MKGMFENLTAEVCCGSYYDALQAEAGGAGRIELNSGLLLGGLTPSMSALRLIKETCRLKVIAMARPRGGGFCYSPEDFQVMRSDCIRLIQNGADGIAFGCLKEGNFIDMERCRELVELIHGAGKEAVFHRAFDCTENAFSSMEQLISLGIDRVLTSGQKASALFGTALIKELQNRYGGDIEILAGSGVNASNARRLIEETGISQVHSSCRGWKRDATAGGREVSFCMSPSPYEDCYDVVDADKVRMLVKSLE